MKRFVLMLLAVLAVQAVVCSADAQTPLRQSTSRVVRICGVVAVGDGFTPVTSLTLSGADEAEALRDNTATLDISGATWAAITGADGCYSLTLDTTATNTVGELIVEINDDSLVLPIWRTFQVIEPVVFDALYADAATGTLPANVTQWLGSAAATPTTAGVPEVDVTHWLGTAAATPTTAGVPEVDVTFGNGTAFSSALFRSNAIQAEGTDFTDAIDARIDARLAAIRLDELLSADSDIDGAAPPTVGSVFFEALTKTAGSWTYDQTTDSPEAIRDRGDAAWITATGFSTHSAADVWAAGTRTLTAATNLGFPTNFGSMDINATGGVGLDWGNVQNPTTTVGLTGTTVDLVSGAVDDTALNSAADLQAAAAAALNAEDGGNFTALVTAILQGNGVPAPTTIATLASQTSFTLAAGSADDNAYNGYGIVIRDASTATQQALGCIRDYTGSSKTVTLLDDPGVFTMATTDNVAILPAFCDAQVQQDLLDTAILTCTVDTANFAGSSTTFACDLTDSAGVAVTTNIATDELKGKPFKVLSGAQKYEERYVFDTTWDGTNNELQVTIAASYPFSATLADGVIIVLE